eukprot:UN08167
MFGGGFDTSFSRKYSKSQSRPSSGFSGGRTGGGPQGFHVFSQAEIDEIFSNTFGRHGPFGNPQGFGQHASTAQGSRSNQVVSETSSSTIKILVMVELFKYR